MIGEEKREQDNRTGYFSSGSLGLACCRIVDSKPNVAAISDCQISLQNAYSRRTQVRNMAKEIKRGHSEVLLSCGTMLGNLPLRAAHSAYVSRLNWNLAGFSDEGGTRGLGRKPILLIPGEMLEFGLIQFEVRQNLLADGTPLWRILAFP